VAALLRPLGELVLKPDRQRAWRAFTVSVPRSRDWPSALTVVRSASCGNDRVTVRRASHRKEKTYGEDEVLARGCALCGRGCGSQCWSGSGWWG